MYKEKVKYLYYKSNLINKIKTLLVNNFLYLTQMKFHSTTNNIVPCLTKMLEDKFQISNLTSMMFQYQLLLQQFQSQLQPIVHKANQSMHRELILSK